MLAKITESTALELLPSPGIYTVPASLYHAWPYASASRLNRLNGSSPQHVKHEMSTASEPTPAMVLGSAIHTMLLEPAAFGNLYSVSPFETFYSKEAKAWKADLISSGKMPLTNDQWRRIMGVSVTAGKNPTICDLLWARTHTELSLVWDDKETGVRCKARIDGLVKVGAVDVLFDLKSTSSAFPADFQKSIFNFGYHRQCAHYLAGLRAHDIMADSAVIAAVETDEPYANAVYRITDQVMELGGREVSELLRRWKEAESGGWPGYPTEIQDIELPAWAMRNA